MGQSDFVHPFVDFPMRIHSSVEVWHCSILFLHV
uniref:Uncharacterized protein n=1 Tax=Anguilla anguilla TaxID=7936 RepID=A0A0E9REN7_ANGAN